MLDKLLDIGFIKYDHKSIYSDAFSYKYENIIIYYYVNYGTLAIYKDSNLVFQYHYIKNIDISYKESKFDDFFIWIREEKFKSLGLL